MKASIQGLSSQRDISNSSILTVGPWADVKNGFTWKIIVVLKVRGDHGE